MLGDMKCPAGGTGVPSASIGSGFLSSPIEIGTVCASNEISMPSRTIGFPSRPNGKAFFYVPASRRTSFQYEARPSASDTIGL